MIGTPNIGRRMSFGKYCMVFLQDFVVCILAEVYQIKLEKNVVGWESEMKKVHTSKKFGIFFEIGLDLNTVLVANKFSVKKLKHFLECNVPLIKQSLISFSLICCMLIIKLFNLKKDT